MKFDLILSKSLTWKVSAFFRSIFQKKVVKITMDWNKVLGAKGRAHIKQKVYTNQSDEEKNINDLDYFIDYDEKSFSEVVNDKDIPFLEVNAMLRLYQVEAVNEIQNEWDIGYKKLRSSNNILLIDVLICVHSKLLCDKLFYNLIILLWRK